ncbi:MAG: type II toxin-antitoxin system RelE/ParE family toxin [Rubrivivax sp.]|nr:MAG: type II toxin-antitoxin system RelE/ParE family toxin [Rubrivivax sp.]
MKRVFKTRAFDRWAKKLVPDGLLCLAARDIEAGRFEADLGHGLCKKRIAVAGRGKRGGLRALVAKRHAEAIFFVLGREKNEPGTDFPLAVLEVARQTALDLQGMSLGDMSEPIRRGQLMEICNGTKGS